MPHSDYNIGAALSGKKLSPRAQLLHMAAELDMQAGKAEEQADLNRRLARDSAADAKEKRSLAQAYRAAATAIEIHEEAHP